MTPPVIRNEGPSPSGVLPRRAQWLVFGGIAGAVVLASLFSGQKARRITPPALPAGPVPGDAVALQKRLQMEKQAFEESEGRLKARQQELQSTLQATQPSNVTAPDPVEAERRARSARAPYASSVVLHFEERDRKETAEPKTQIAFVVEDKKEASAPIAAMPKASEPKLKESGLQLPLRDGDKHRLQQGTLIPITLLNRLEGSFTGPVKCVVARAILSEDETALLIPKGSEVYGQARKVEEANQTRLAITFDRLALKNGYSVNLDGAPGLDSNGESGIAGKVNKHNARNITVGGVLGAIGGLALYAGRGGPYVGGVANSTGSSAGSILNRSLSSLPSITIPEGKTIYLYLQKDFVLPEYRPENGAERTSK
jgi:type IV secretion system protein VirB10